ncbi:MAG: hypothetical protein JJ896_15095 [Rhodothermales bacterium]|nr:hypothetical protein [Rhodothermales bacterium]MBO6780979.1 hypothetical protein [Rhodothermales bacterium]
MPAITLPSRSAHLASLLFLVTLALGSCATPALAQDVRLAESFDTPTAPSLPADWTGDWVTSSSSASSGSGQNNLVDTGTGAATATSPSFSLAGAGSATITYLARRTSSYPAEALSLILETSAGDVAVPGAGLPAGASSWQSLAFTVPAAALGEATVRLRFESAGGSSSGSNARIDDLQVAIETAGAGGGTFGHASADTLDVLAETTGLLLPLTLNWSGSETLQGVQFDLSPDTSALQLTGFLRGPAVADLGAWTVTHEGSTSIALANAQDGLTAGTYAPLISAVIDVGPVADTTLATVTLSNVVGAQATPHGTDAGLVAGPAARTLRILPLVAVFDVQDSLTVGEAPVGGSVQTDLWLHNRGTAPLTVAAGTDHAAFALSPVLFTIPAADSALAAVTFTPGTAEIGSVSARLLIDGTPQTVLTATGIAGWGDATDDGYVDVGDIVLGVDVAIGRTGGTSNQRQSLDVYPFPAGDGAIDIRDLTVLTQAVLRGQWPNAVLLPDGGGAAQAATTASKSGDIHFTLEDHRLSVTLTREIRGLQAEFRWHGGSARLGDALIAQNADRLRILWAPLYGELLPTGSHAIAQLTDGPETPELLMGVAIGAAHERIALAPPEQPEGALARPYPNPFAPDADAQLILPGSEEAAVVDLLGREIWRGRGTWDGRTRAGIPAAAGYYSVRTGGRSYPILLVRRNQ